jgi:ribosome-associated toxin RatA of RatAB toxin-antitoxin module
VLLGIAGLSTLAHASEGAKTMDRILADSTQTFEVGDVEVTSKRVPGSEYRRTIAVGLIDASPEAVWAVIEDCGRYAGRLPRIIESRVRKQQGNARECEVKVDFPAPLKDARVVTRAVDQVQGGTRWHRDWTLLEGDFVTNAGSWTLVPWKGRTLAVYAVHVEPRSKVSPGLQKLVQSRTVPKLFARIGELARG